MDWLGSHGHVDSRKEWSDSLAKQGPSSRNPLSCSLHLASIMPIEDGDCQDRGLGGAGYTKPRGFEKLGRLSGQQALKDVLSSVAISQRWKPLRRSVSGYNPSHLHSWRSSHYRRFLALCFLDLQGQGMKSCVCLHQWWLFFRLWSWYSIMMKASEHAGTSFLRACKSLWRLWRQ